MYYYLRTSEKGLLHSLEGMKRSFTEKWHLRWAKYVIGLPAWSFPTMPGMQREPGQKGEGEHARETEKRTASK